MHECGYRPRMRRLIAILPLLALTACSQARTASSSPLDSTLTWLPSQLCDRWERCVGENAPPWGSEACEVWMGRYLENVVHARFDEGIRRGTLSVNAGAERDCAAALGGTCEWEALADVGSGLGSLGALATLSCSEVVLGQVAVGGECVMSEECAGEAFCAPTCTGCAGVCRTRIPEGGAGCLRDAECASGLACLGSTCTSLPAIGFACAMREGRRCALGARCEAGMCIDVNDTPGMPGGACGTGLAPCDTGLYCRESRCTTELRAGEPCVNGLGGAGGVGCGRGLWCTPMGQCAAALGEGAACVPTSGGAAACSSPLVCGQGNACITPRDNGASCVSAIECASRNCAAARCAPPPYQSAG